MIRAIRERLIPFRQWLTFAGPHAGLIWGAFAATVVVLGIELALPKAVGYIVDTLLRQDVIDRGNAELPFFGRFDLTTAFLVVLACLAAAMLLKAGMTYLRNMLLALTGEKIHVDVRSRLFAHLQRLPISYFDSSYTGRVMARLTTDTDALWHFLYNGMLNVVTPLLTVVGVLILLFRMDALLALLSCAVVPIMAVLFARADKKAKTATWEQRETLADIYTRLQEQIAGIRIVRLFGSSHEEQKIFTGYLRKLFSRNMTMVRAFALLSAQTELVTGLGISLILAGGGIVAVHGGITAGELVQFYLYSSLLFTPLRQLTGTTAQLFVTAEASLLRISEMLAEPEAVEHSHGRRECPRLAGDIRVDGLTFSYVEGKPILADISFHATPGETIALVGPSGVGKTTLVNLLCRFYHYEQGNISVDGHDIQDFEVQSYRDQISYIMQDNFLFTGSVFENIAYAKRDASRKEIEEAARRANAHDFIMRLSDGYDTLVGERGAQLSGGQRQRINIARSLLRKPSIIILDEPTSALDTESESVLLEALRTVYRDITTIIIAHRLSTVMAADKTLVFSEGRIAQSGTHADLMVEDGPYRELFRGQVVGGWWKGQK